MTRPAAGLRVILRLALAPALLALAVALAAPTIALGATPVSVSVQAPASAAIGSEVIVKASIKRADGGTPSGLRVGLYLDNEFLQSSHADAHGNVDFRVRGAATESAGKVTLQVRFDGTSGLGPASASTSLVLRAAQIKVNTVPAVPGIPISVGDSKATTGADGVAIVSVDRIGAMAMEPLLDQVSDKSIRVSFARWGDQVFDQKRRVDVRGDATYVLGLRTAYQASLRFVDLGGGPIDPKTITRARFTSSTGAELILTAFDNVWWEAGTAVTRIGGLQPSTTLWRLSEVTMAGTNVVNQGQQAFSPTVNGSWTISLLLYDLVVRAQDAVSGSAVSGSAELTFPDTTTRTQPVGADGTTVFRGLPRGYFTLAVKFDGISPPTPIALSRSQEALIRVISYADIVAGIGVALLIAVILLWIGRRRHVLWLVRVTEVPAGIVRRASGRIGRSNAVGRRPTSALARIPSDLATIGGGQVSSAVGFVGVLVRRAAGLVVTVAAATAHGATATARRAAASLGESRARARQQPAAAQAATAAAGTSMSGGHVVSTVPSTQAPPAWPERPSRITTSGEPAATSATRRRASARVIETERPSGRSPSTSQSWFEPEPDEGPTHECPQCHRQVPDGARFCRSCGRLQA